MRTFLSVYLVLITGLGLGFGGCAQQRVQLIPPAGMSNPDPALADSVAFSEELAWYHELPPEERAARQEIAEDALSSWEQFEEMARKRRDRRERPYLHEDLPPDRRGFLTGLAGALNHLDEASELDPTDSVAWAALGHLHLEIGDLITARGYLEMARWAANYEDPLGRMIHPEVLLQLHRDRCWVLRDLGLWEEGLAAVAEGPAARSRVHHGEECTGVFQLLSVPVVSVTECQTRTATILSGQN